MGIGLADPAILVVDLELRPSVAADLPPTVDRLPLRVEVPAGALGAAAADILSAIGIGDHVMGARTVTCFSHDGLLSRESAKVGSLLRTCAQDRYCRCGVSRTRCIAITNPADKQENTRCQHPWESAFASSD